MRKIRKKIIKPDPLGKKSRPTMLSKTEDFPELCSNFKRYKKRKWIRTYTQNSDAKIKLSKTKQFSQTPLIFFWKKKGKHRLFRLISCIKNKQKIKTKAPKKTV